MKTVVRTDVLMQPIAHFSHAARLGDLIHVGATAGTDARRRLVGSTAGMADLSAQLERMLENIDTVLSLLGGKRSQLVRIKTYVTDVRDFAASRSAVDHWLGGINACHVSVGSTGFPLPQALVEADAVAALSTVATPHHLLALPSAVAGELLPADADAQLASVLDDLQRQLDACGLALSDLVHVHATLPDRRVVPALQAAFGRRLSHPAPARTVVLAPLPATDALVQLECIALAGGGRPVPGFDPADATSPPPAMLAGEHLYFGGLTGTLDDGRFADGVRAQTEAAWRLVESILDAAGFAPTTVVRSNNVLVDWRHYAEFNAGYGGHVQRPYPPRATVLSGLVDPGALVQIELIAHRGGGSATVLDTPFPPAAALGVAQ